MEQHRDKMRQRGTRLTTDRETRMKAPPPKTYAQDPLLGASLGVKAKPTSSANGSRPLSQQHKQPRQVSVDVVDLADSDDELLIVPRSRQGSREPGTSRSSSVNRTPSEDPPAPMTPVSLVVDGQVYAPHPDYPVDEKEKLKNMKFRKMKSVEEDTAPTLSDPSEDPSRARKPLRPGHSTNQSVTRRQEASARKPYKAPTVMDPSKLPPRRSSPVRSTPRSPLRSRDEADVDETPKPPRPRPRPRPVKKVPSLASQLDVVNSEPDAATDVADEGKGKGKAREPEDWPMANASPVKYPGNAHTSTRTCPIDDLSPLKESSNSRKVPRSFPMDESPLWRDENTWDQERYARSSSQSSPKALRSVQSFPNISPLSTPTKPPPSSSSVQSSQDSSSGSGRKKDPIVIVSEDSNSDGELPKPRRRIKATRPPKVRPFPMATQLFGESQTGKRGSSDAERSGEDTERRKKKRARGADEILRELMHSDGMSDEEDDILWNDPDLDPTRLCPWCDELLPPEPSPHLRHLMSIARARSHSDSRPTNPLGLRAEPTVFVNVCQRHRFERHQIPLARRRGWPTHIEWSRLGKRVRGLKYDLQRIVDDVDEEFLPGRERTGDESDAEDLNVDAKDDEDLLVSRPRKGSALWRDVVKSVKKRGVHKAAGVRGQMTSFTKTQPGYYGELGSVIISQTIYDLFPPVDFPPNSTLPLTPTEFIQHILVPEAALRLVMEDMHQSRAEALKTLRDSAQYGVAMFPDDHTEGNLASEAIVKARAAARRKEIEQQDEDDSDAALWSAFPEDEVVRAASSRSSRAASVESTRPRRACVERTAPIVESDSGSDVSMTSARSRARKPRGKPQSRADSAAPRKAKPPSAASRDLSIEVLSDAPSTKASRPRPRPKAKAPGATPHASDIDTDHAVGASGSQRTPRAGKTQRRVASGTSGLGAGSSRKVDEESVWQRNLRGCDSSDE